MNIYKEDDDLLLFKEQIIKLVLKINDPKIIIEIFNMVNKKYIEQ